MITVYVWPVGGACIVIVRGGRRWSRSGTGSAAQVDGARLAGQRGLHRDRAGWPALVALRERLGRRMITMCG